MIRYKKIYKCKKCPYTTNRKSSFINHLKRKKPCNKVLLIPEENIIKSELHNSKEDSNQEIITDVLMEFLKKKFPTANSSNNNIKEIQFIQKGIEFMENEIESINSEKESINSDMESITSEKKFIKNQCKFCYKCYSTNSNWNKHLKICKVKKEKENKLKLENENKELENMKLKKLKIKNKELKLQLENKDKELKNKELKDLKLQLVNKDKELKLVKKEMKEEIKLVKKEMKEEIKMLLKKIGNTTNNTSNTSNNITNNTKNDINIHVNNYGDFKENIDYLSEKYLISLTKRPHKGVITLIKDIHFNKDHPENHNIKITNKKFPYVSIYKNNKWKLKEKEIVLETLLDRNCCLLQEDSFEEGTLDPDRQERLDKFCEKYHKNNNIKNGNKELRRQAELCIINNTKIIHGSK